MREDGVTTAEQTRAQFAIVLRYLMRHPVPRLDRKTTLAEVAAYAQDRGCRCTVTYVSRLRNPDNPTNVSLRLVRVIADFFDVPAAVFTESGWTRAQLDEAIRLHRLVKDESWQLRSARVLGELRPETLAALLPHLADALQSHTRAGPRVPAQATPRFLAAPPSGSDA